MADILVYNIGDLVSMEPLVQEQRFTHITPADLGRLKGGWLAVSNGKVLALGTKEPPRSFSQANTIDARGCLVLPGLVDCHTHPIYGGNRSHEFTRRLSGATYQDIAQEGGGIRYTVAQTRAASDAELLKTCLEAAHAFLGHGVTAFEAKSGYGLSVEEELRLLRILGNMAKQCPQTVAITLLALHAVPKEAASQEAFVDDMTSRLLPEVSRGKLATWVDAFIEQGYFTKEDARKHFTKAKALGLGIRVHADEFSDGGGGLFAAEMSAASADHLEHTSSSGIKAMAGKGVVAVLLPGTSLYTKIPFADARPFIKAGCPVALATDFNPGSCRVRNLNFIASLGSLHCGLDLPHALAAVTWVAARALRLEANQGALSPGMAANFSIFPYQTCEDWLADFGQKTPTSVYIKGKVQDIGSAQS